MQDCTKRTQVLHRMRLRQFTTRQLIPHIQITQRKLKPDPEVVINHDDLYARARECENEKSLFDSDYKNSVTPKSPEITEKPEVAADGTNIIPGIVREVYTKILPQADRSCDGTDTDH